MAAVIFAIVYFFVIYRVAPFSSIPYVSILVGMVGAVVFTYEILTHKVRFPKRFIPVVASLVTLMFYLIAIDTAAVVVGNSSELGTLRLVAAVGLSIMPAYLLASVARGHPQFVSNVLFYVILIQLTFFIIIYLFPSNKLVIYSIFDMHESVNLKSWNLERRGFGVSKEINYLAPITTVLIACLVSKNFLFRIFVLATQVLNTNLALLAALFVFAGRKLIRGVWLIGFLVLMAVLFQKQLLEAVEVYAPRLNAELNSGFTNTFEALLRGHVHWLTDDFTSILFGTGVLITSADNIFNVRSDIGWVNLYNYGGVSLVILFFIFLLSIVLPLRHGFAQYRGPLFIALVLVNVKGLFLGPNSLLFTVFLLQFCGAGESNTSKSKIRAQQESGRDFTLKNV